MRINAMGCQNQHLENLQAGDVFKCQDLYYMLMYYGGRGKPTEAAVINLETADVHTMDWDTLVTPYPKAELRLVP